MSQADTTVFSYYAEDTQDMYVVWNLSNLARKRTRTS